MQLIFHLFLGFVMAFVGLTPPGMLNMTAVSTRIEQNKKSAILFSLAAAIVVIPQAYIALAFTSYFANHPEIIDHLTMVGVVILFILSVFFFFQARKKFKGEDKKRRVIF